MLTINKNKYKHFFIDKKPEIKISSEKKDKKVIFFINNEKRFKILYWAKKIASEIFEYKCISIMYYEKPTKILFFFKTDKVWSQESRKTYENLFRKLLMVKFDLDITVVINNFNLIFKDSVIDFNFIHKSVMNVVRNNAREYLPPMTKEGRAIVNLELTKYRTIKHKTTGSFGGKCICIFRKKRK